MSKFVCPECNEEIEGDNENQAAAMASDHMEEEHGKKRIRAYIMDNIKAH